jgi:septum formation protein
LADNVRELLQLTSLEVRFLPRTANKAPASEDAGYSNMKLILASSSPRRADVLRDAGIAFEVCAGQVNEARRPGEAAQEMVARLAEAKARAAAAQPGYSERRSIVIGADTAVELDGEIFGKPRDTAHASEMLAALSGRMHRVVTGIFLLRLPDGAARSAVERTSVTFAPLEHEEIETYVATGEPLDKAGAYAIQGRAGRYISRIEGCYFNVVGLPLARLHERLRELGWRDNSHM